ncbi:MAG: transporter [Bacteroidales bacterium]|nr:transporter [Bacteroidales bacterium]
MQLTHTLRNWMLPVSMTLGVGIYLALHLSGSPGEEGYLRVCVAVQPVMVAVMLFLQLNLVAPRDLRFHRWHLWVLLIQTLLFVAMATLTLVTTGGARVLFECAMLCFVCPTAAAAGVITSKLGGDLPGIMTYTVLANALASVLIPLMVPLVHPAVDMGFLPLFWAVVRRVFSILILPLLAAWLIRWLLPGLQRWLERYAGWAFYIWGICLMLSISLATDSLAGSGIGLGVALGIGGVSLACCLLQFALGRRAARRYGHAESVTAGQALGQKNTGFIIWLGINYLTPVTSVAGGLYAIWHNLFNSWQLLRSSRK